ncbi:hypothetical protein PHYSODRAFT_522988 [Phytophthora sojae]|uniref:Uncharacterized protein n=1 Tax=Phytophthora sojae (strain P6497) TaxID=1094619 RepID=G5A3U1_PHYSP|nr:hypothetical protein PHYSODRAFT_522988 [Phytophthora sojae]EGZ09441.1 hypothetical protein PHYSODRAFT_522988 [Phytophthora sojae]|eukprot:XP_009534302.1 hypothetical protein PHYSODRAFT_522988 [Phytophthora sojae]
MEELYERVLAHVSTPQLHKSYNDILYEEFASVAQTLSDVLAAFAKLEEVHGAVSKLQQSHDSSTGDRSDSLIASADNTMKLQQHLQHEVEKLAAGMEVSRQERKRKRTVGTNVDSDSASESSEEEEETKISAQGPSSKLGGDSLGIMKRKVAVSSGFESESDNNGEDNSDDDADDVEGSEAAWRALMTKSDDPSSEVEPELSPAKKQADTDTKVAVKRLSRTVWYVKVIVDEVKKLSRVDRSFIMPDLLAALKESVEEDVNGLYSSGVTSSMKVLVGWWTHGSEYEAQHAELYHEYVAVVQSYYNQFRCSRRKRGQKRLLENMSEAILDPSNSKNHKKLIKLGKDATQVLGELKKWRGRSITPREAFKLKEAVEALVEDMTIGWNPCQDITMRKCVKELKSILVQAQAQASGDAKSKRGFEVCLSVVLRWKVEDPPAVHIVRAPTE